MRKITRIIISVLIVVMVFAQSYFKQAFAYQDPSYVKTALSSKLDLRKYFEEAMSLFESGKYKEAVMLFEKIIEIEKSQDSSYYTPFADIYIDKSKARIREMVVLQEKKLEKMKRDVIDEAVEIARQKEERIIREEEERLAREAEKKRQMIESAGREEQYALERDLNETFDQAMGYYRNNNYPLAMIEFKKIKEISPDSALARQAEYYINNIKRQIKRQEERMILVRMEEARRARIEMEREANRKKIAAEKKALQKMAIRRGFEQRLRQKEIRERILKISSLMDNIVSHISRRRYDEAKTVLDSAIEEFPENERFKDILHYIEMQNIKSEENALKRAREITEERMLLDVAKKHIMPEEPELTLQKKKKITPIVKIPEIRKRLKIPISVDFKDVELDSVLSFLSDATGVNIVPSSEIDMAQKKVTIKIKDMPLEEALRYILKAQDLVYRIEQDAVWVAAQDELDKENVDTRVYFLNQGVGRFAEFSSTSKSESGSTGEGRVKTSGTVPSEVKTVKDILQNSVDWPKDSKLTLDERTGALIISNIPSNLEVIENLLYNLDVTPVQVLIEARFLEVKVTDLDDVGIEWKLNTMWGVQRNNSKKRIHGIASNSGVDFSSFSRSDEGFNLTYQGILTTPQFQAVLHALQEKKNVKTLSAPRITTLNNQMATIEVIDEYIYPTRYEVSLVQFDINGDGDFDDAGETEWANIPQDFVTRNVGILLHVKPSVGIDKKSITLALAPEVSEDAGSYSYSGNVTIPKFTTRNLSTSVVVNNGETVVLGGLIKETNTTVKTKVPFLGDLPVVGGLFKKSADEKERRNLLIFVTASVMDKPEEVVASVPRDKAVDKVIGE